MAETNNFKVTGNYLIRTKVAPIVRTAFRQNATDVRNDTSNNRILIDGPRGASTILLYSEFAGGIMAFGGVAISDPLLVMDWLYANTGNY